MSDQESGSAGETHHQGGLGEPDALERLWTPHRMAYISGENKPADGTADTCPFCQIPQLSDVDGLVVHRGEQCFVVLNLYPYSSGHLMVCPFRHVAGYPDLTEEETVEVARLTQRAMRVIKTVSGAHGFNVGMNQGVGGRRRHRRPPAPARRAALGRRRQLHADHRAHQDAAAAADRDPSAARGGLAHGVNFATV